MSNNEYVITKNGAAWIANRLIGNANNLNLMYVVYSSGNRTPLDIDRDTDSTYFNNMNDASYIRITGNITTSISEADTDGSVNAVVSCIVSPDMIPESNGSIIAIATGYTQENGNDVIVSVCNIDNVSFVSNLSLAVSCPLCISPFDGGTDK